MKRKTDESRCLGESMKTLFIVNPKLNGFISMTESKMDESSGNIEGKQTEYRVYYCYHRKEFHIDGRYWEESTLITDNDTGIVCFSDG